MADKKKYAEMEMELKKGISMPGVGLGAYKLRNQELVYETLKYTMQPGYRRYYKGFGVGKEKISGEAQPLQPKSDVIGHVSCVAEKLSILCSSGKYIPKAFVRSLKNMEGDYIEMHLIHFLGPPYSYKEVAQHAAAKTETWMALAKVYDESKVHAVNVSNFGVRHLVELTQVMAIGPVVNQIYWQPYCYQREVMIYSCDYNIKIQGWNAYAEMSHSRSILMAESITYEIAARYNATTNQVLLLWALKRGIAVIPKSKDAVQAMINKNLQFRLLKKEMFELDALSIKNQLFWESTNVF